MLNPSKNPWECEDCISCELELYWRKLSGQNDPEFDPPDFKRNTSEPQKTMYGGRGSGAAWRRWAALP